MGLSVCKDDAQYLRWQLSTLQLNVYRSGYITVADWLKFTSNFYFSVPDLE
jgi:hypothetical protein